MTKRKWLRGLENILHFIRAILTMNHTNKMPVAHVLLTLMVVVIWGINFIFVKLSLQEISPLLLCALRFLLASVPAIFFTEFPKAPFKTVAAYGLIMFALQFGLLFVGMNIGMTAGMASLIMQVQVFFSLFFAAIVLGERPSTLQVTGAFVSFTGIVVVAMHFDSNVSLLGFFAILAAASSWGIGNLITKKLHKVNMMSLVIWGSFIACFPMVILSISLEGTESIAYTLEHLTWIGTGSLLYIAYASTWVGYGVWNWLLVRHPVSVVVPFTLLVPIIGLLTSVCFFDETFENWKAIAAFLVIGGLCLNTLGVRIFALFPRRRLEIVLSNK